MQSNRTILRAEIVSVFDDPNQLRQALREGTPTRGFDEFVTSTSDYGTQVFQLIDRANKDGWLRELINTLLAVRAGNQLFAAKVQPIADRLAAGNSLDDLTVGMSFNIKDQYLAELADQIGDVFLFQDLKVFLFKCFGDENKINAFALPDWPPRKIAFEVLSGVDKAGESREFLAQILQDDRCNEGLSKLILTIDPDLKGFSYELKPIVTAFAAGLDSIPLARNPVPESLMAAAKSLKLFTESASILSAYKGLHDSLHLLQTGSSMGDLEVAAEKITEARSVEMLSGFRDRLRAAYVLAEELADGLPDDERRNTELTWIKKLERIASELREAITTKDAGLAYLWLGVMQLLFEQEPSRLNGLIVAAANALPLQPLADRLDQAANSTSLNREAILSIARAALQLASAFRSHIVEHRLWQQADDALVVIDRLVKDSGFSLVRRFAAVWLQVEPTIDQLIAGAGYDVWVQNIRDYSVLVKDGLTKITNQRTAISEEDINELIIRRYNDYRGEVRYQFFQVDRNLKKDCALISGLSTPINKLTEGLMHD
jgi:Effector-associated domain 1